MDASSLEAMLFDPTKCSNFSMEQKRELVYEVAKWPGSATELLLSWSRNEILEILCAELGKERKYTGLPKSKLIEQLLKVIHEKKSLNQEIGPSLENGERNFKRQKKSEDTAVAYNSHPDNCLGNTNVLLCKNSACKAKMSRVDKFCKRCSCCICCKYDDNKDPSLWLVCNSDLPFYGSSCGMSCHLDCALRHENSGISKDRQDKGLDGSFCCVSCGKVNDLLGPWRKQLVIARDTRRVDELCYRLSLGRKILGGTKHYQNLYGILNEAVQKLVEDVGPLTGIPAKARGIVNRLSSGPEVQKLCASAVESLDAILSNRVSDSPTDCNTLAVKLVKFEDIQASSITVILNSDDSNLENVAGYTLFHRKVNDSHYPMEPTCRLFTSNTKFQLSGLSPSTQYFLKVAIFDTDREMGYCEFQFQTGNHPIEARNLNIQSPTTNFSSLSNPSSGEDEITTNNSNYNLPFFSGPADKASSANLLAETIQKETDKEYIMISLSDDDDERSNIRKKSKKKESIIPTGLECVPYVERTSSLPITPCKVEKGNDGIKRNVRPEPQAGSSSKKRSDENRGKESDKGFEYYVKVMRNLECDGHIETEFRQKFLSWYSLRATSQEVRIVKAFIDTFIEDPESLAGQLVDAFSDIIANNKCSTVPAGFCTKLWH